MRLRSEVNTRRTIIHIEECSDAIVAGIYCQLSATDLYLNVNGNGEIDTFEAIHLT